MIRRSLLLCTLIAAWGGEDEEPSVTLSSIETEVFAVSCNQPSCHSVAGKKGGLILADKQAFANLVGVAAEQTAAQSEGLKRVVAGDPAKSFLYLKMKAPLDAKYEAIMPFGNSAGLDAARLAKVEAWINGGAKND